MRQLLSLTVAVGVLLTVTLATAADDKPWFDMENCAYCKHIGAEKGLMEHMHSEYHNLSKGMLSITTVDKEYQEAFDRAQAKMQKVGEEMMKTKEVPPMCGHCRAYGDFVMSGINPEYVASSVGHIMVWTSDDPEVVKKLQAFGKRNTDEMAKMKHGHKSMD